MSSLDNRYPKAHLLLHIHAVVVQDIGSLKNTLSHIVQASMSQIYLEKQYDVSSITIVSV